MYTSEDKLTTTQSIDHALEPAQSCGTPKKGHDKLVKNMSI